MAKLPASLMLACLLTFSAGCLGDDSPSPAAAEAQDPANVEGPASETAPAPATVEEPPKCPGGSNNYGIDLTVGGLYVHSTQGPGVVVYQESNGCSGLQTESAWPHNPDTAILDPGAAASPKA
jgi:hypothetical protein